MIAANLPRACGDGDDLAARSHLLLAAHLAGVAMANTGLGICHAIGHSLGGRWNIAHGVALSTLLPYVLQLAPGPARLACAPPAGAAPRMRSSAARRVPHPLAAREAHGTRRPRDRA